MMNFRLLAASFLVWGVLGSGRDDALAGKIQQSREKLENGESRSGSGIGSSGSASKTSSSADDDDCSFFAFVFGLCGRTTPPAAEENSEPGDIRMEVSPYAPPPEQDVPTDGEALTSAATTDEPSKEDDFTGKARVEFLHGRNGSEHWSQFGLDLGFGNDGGGIFISAEGMQVREVSAQGVTLDSAAIVPFSLALQIGSPWQKITLGWGWAFTSGLASAEGRFWRLQMELTPFPQSHIQPVFRASMRTIWFRDIYFYNFRGDAGLLIARHLEVFAGGSYASLDEINWNWLHIGIGVRR